MVTAAPIVTANKKPLLALIQTVTDELGIQNPSSILGNTDDQVRQLLALANREGKEFSTYSLAKGGWQELRKEYVFSTTGVGIYTGNTVINTTTIKGLSSTTGITAGMTAVGSGIPVGALVLSVDSSTQVTLDSQATATASSISFTFGNSSYTLPADFSYFIAQTFWDRSFRWQILGPLEAQEWQVLKSGISPTGPRRRFRIMGNLFYIDPVPSETTTNLVFEYYSNGWCQSASGTAQSIWAADTDYYTLDDDCFILGLKWRFLRAKGLDYSEEMLTYQNTVERVMARDGGNRNLPLNASASGIRLLNNQNVPDTGFGS